MIECDAPTSNLPAILALPRYGIAKRGGGKLAGSGPFAINRLGPGQEAYTDCARRLLGRARICGLHRDRNGQELPRTDDRARSGQSGHRRGRAGSGASRALRKDGASRTRLPRNGWRWSSAATASRRKREIAPGAGAQHRSGGDERRSAAGRRRTRRHIPSRLDDRLRFPLPYRGRSRSGPARSGAKYARRRLDAGLRCVGSAGASHCRENRTECARCRAYAATYQRHSKAADMRLVRMPLPSLDARVALSELAASLGLPSTEL